jgi:hypothetical protein
LRYGGQRDAGQLHLRSFTGKVTWCDAEKELERCVKSGGLDFGNLPRVYYGIVRRRCIERVRETCGCYLPGISPDMAGSVAVASFVKRMCLVDYPLFVPGKSGGSASGLGAMKKHIGKLEDQPHLSREFIDSWPRIVPRFFAGSTMWAAAAIQALEATGRGDLLPSVATARLHAFTAALEPHWTSTVVHNFHIVSRRRPSKYSIELLRFLLHYAHCVSRRAHSLVANRIRTDSTKRIRNVRDIYHATMELARYAAEGNFPFDESPPQKIAA